MIEFDPDELAALAAEHQVAKGPDGGLRDREGSVSDALACMLLAHGSGTHPVGPGGYRRGYISAGHAADSPANRRTAQPVPVPDIATGGRSTTPPDDGDGVAGPGAEVEKVVVPPGFRVAEAQDFRGGPLTAGHEAPSPGDAGDNNPVLPVTGSGHAMYGHAVSDYSGNVARERAQHVALSQACEARPATAHVALPADLGARNVPVPASPGHLTGRAPGER